MLVALLAACTPATAPPAGGPTAPEPVLSWSERVPTVANVSWAAAPASRSWVEYGLDGALDLATPEVQGPEVVLPLLGLEAGRTYTWRAVSLVGDVQAASDPGELVVPAAPATLPAFTVVAAPGSVVASGWVVVSLMASSVSSDPFVAIYDGAGVPVWWFSHPRGAFTVSPSLGATPGTLLWDRYDLDGGAAAQRIRLDGTASVEVPLLDGHHAVIEPEPDVLAWIARDLRPNPAGDGSVTADRVLEASIHAMDAPREVIGLYDDWYGGAAVAPCLHAETAHTLGDSYPVFEWSHANSLAFDPTEDAYLLNLRWMDTMLLVERPTGALRWQLGGPSGDFTLDGADPYGSADASFLSHAHWSEAGDGSAVVFDNGSHRDPQVSSLVSLTWDADARTIAVGPRWDDGRYVEVLGDVRTLPGGGWLASWSTLGELTEVSPEGQVLWTATAGATDLVGRVLFLPDLYAAAGFTAGAD